MICASLQGLTVFGQRLDCAGSPAFAYVAAAAVVAALVTVMLARSVRRPFGLRAVTAALFVLSLAALVTATERPVLLHEVDVGQGGTLLVLIDASESVWRDRATAQAAVDLAGDRITAFLSALPAAEAGLWRAEVMTFGRVARRAGSDLAADSIPAVLAAAAPTSPADASDLQGGVRAALTVLRAAPGRRMMVLVTDAQTTAAPDDATLAEFRAEGIPVHVITAGADAPAAGLVAANVGPEHWLGEPVVVRGTVLGAGEVTLRDRDQILTEAVADSDHLRPLRLTAQPAARGLQGVALGFVTDVGAQHRSLFTLVRGPSRVLVYGAAPWADALPAERWQVTRADPRSPPDPAAYDVVVIDSLSPDDFAAGADAGLLAAADGTGILLINGALRGSATDEQRISEWQRSVLGPILPVDSDPRLFLQDPPPRDIVVLVDVSGSMMGTRLGTAQSAINAILRQLRPRDSITILPFADSAMPVFPRAQASAEGIEAARRFVAGLTAGGGTAPDQTIRDSARFVSNYCAFFFISDADFAAPATAPQCHTTSISVSDQPFPAIADSWGDTEILGEGGNGDSLTLSYFEPEERAEYWRDGGFQPVTTGRDPALAAAPQVAGLAIAYPRVDARVDLLHAAPPPDPVFAWRRDSARSGVVTGAFLGAMTAEWGGSALAATEAMLDTLLGWQDQDRYLIQLTDRGDRLELAVTELAGDRLAGGALVPGGMLSASLIQPDGSATGVSLTYDPRRGAHVGDIVAPLSEDPYRALLVIEDGQGIQRIPVQFPGRPANRGTGSEALVFGIDLALADRIATGTGGQMLGRAELPHYSLQRHAESTSLHHWLIAAAFLLLALAVWSRDFRST